jgi:hypothetical protein
MSNTDFGGTGPEVGGAWCALHPDQRAVRTCTRCGSFMCSTCDEGGTQTLCPACQQRTSAGRAFPLTRENWTFSALWGYSFETFQRNWVMLSVTMLVFFGIVGVVQLVASILPALGASQKNSALSVVLTIASMFVQQSVQGVLGLGLMRMMFDMHQGGGKVDIGQLFSQLHKAYTYIVTLLLVFLMVGIPIAAFAASVIWVGVTVGRDSLAPVLVVMSVLAFVPLLYFLLPLALLQAEIAYNDGDATPLQLIRNCYAHARNERLSIFGVGFVAGLVTLASCPPWG